MGDRFVFGAPLQNRAGDERAQSHRWGSARQRSTPAGDAEQNRQQCVVTATIGTTNGETEIEVAGGRPCTGRRRAVSVTGGTGRYQNARGQALFDFRQADRVVINFNLIP
jgi:hypothetical protein